jgi:hypothetical protein
MGCMEFRLANKIKIENYDDSNGNEIFPLQICMTVERFFHTPKKPMKNLLKILHNAITIHNTPIHQDRKNNHENDSKNLPVFCTR